MTAREWKPGDRALLPVVVVTQGGSLPAVVETAVAKWQYNVHPSDLIPDDRRPSWLPGQPGDVAEWGGKRWARDGLRWWRFSETDHTAGYEDDDVPADAVLVLPAKTREATS